MTLTSQSHTNIIPTVVFVNGVAALEQKKDRFYSIIVRADAMETTLNVRLVIDQVVTGGVSLR